MKQPEAQVNVDDSNLFEWVFKGLVGLVLGAGALMWKGLVKRVEDTEKGLNDHMLYSAKNYIEKDAIDRVHERIDDVSKDIKTLLTRVGHGKH
jgi:uncharacterized protein YlzI (FlbEa/FlbD family)